MRRIKVALVGQPNVGKSHLINSISGANLRVGNFAGVTVEKHLALFNYRDFDFEIIDLPGTYALDDFTKDERVTREFLLHEEYDIIVNVLDSTNLERNLYLTTELMELNKRMVIALNMSDEADVEGIEIDEIYLSEILGIRCIKTSAAKKTGIETLLGAIVETMRSDYVKPKLYFSDLVEGEIYKLIDFLEEKRYKHDALEHRDVALKLLKQDREFYKIIHERPIWMELQPIVQESLNELYTKYETKDIEEIFLLERHSYSRGAAVDAMSFKEVKKENLTQKIDAILIDRIFGIPLFIFLMWVLFQLTFELGAIPMEWIDAGFSVIGEALGKELEEGALKSLLVDGIIGGVGAVVMFLPNIMILFLGIALLETTGYMSRVAFLLDGFFHKFGLHGKSFIPLITGFGCSVPAYMSARTLKSEKDRLLTMFIIGFMSCGAKLPVYVLFAGTFFSESQAGNVLFIIYISGALLGLVAAKILRIFVFRGEDEPFVMEMPKYRLPSLKLIWMMVYHKSIMYLKKAGTFILAASLLIWFIGSYPKNSLLEEEYMAKIALVSPNEARLLENELNEKLMEQSYIGQLGRLVEPIFEPIGFDWKMSVATISGLAAKEVIVSTLGVLYSIGDEVDEESRSLQEILKSQITLPSAVAFIVFVMIYLPCLAATAVFAREVNNNKYVLYLALFSLGSAWLLAFIAKAATELLFL